jgi:hypothetical protein
MVRFICHLHLAGGPSLMGRDEVERRFEPRRLQIGHQTPGNFGWLPGGLNPTCAPLRRRIPNNLPVLHDDG